MPLVQGATAEHSRDTRLRSAAQEFEASLLKELLAPLERDPLSAPGESSEDGQALEGFASECLARRLAASGGFGLADRMMAELRRFQRDGRESRPAAPGVR